MGAAWKTFVGLSALGVTGVGTLHYTPKHKQAMKQPDASKWAEAIDLLLQQLVQLKIFGGSLLKSEGTQQFGTCQIFKKKRIADE